METAAPETVNDAVMMTLAAIAARHGVSKPAVSKKIAQLADRHGDDALGLERDNLGRVARLNVVKYEALRGITDDPSKVQAPRLSNTASPPPDSAQSYDEALRTKTWIDAERARLRLDEEIGKLVRVEELGDALEKVGGEIARIVDRLAGEADHLAVEVGREGAHGARRLLKAVALRMREEIADAIEKLIDGSQPEATARTS